MGYGVQAEGGPEKQTTTSPLYDKSVCSKKEKKMGQGRGGEQTICDGGCIGAGDGLDQTLFFTFSTV